MSATLQPHFNYNFNFTTTTTITTALHYNCNFNYSYNYNSYNYYSYCNYYNYYNWDKYNFNCTSTTLQLQLQPLQLQQHQPHYNYNYKCSYCTTPHFIQELWVRWPLQPLQALEKAQLQPPFGPSVDSLCHPCIKTKHLSYSVLSLKLPPPSCAVLLVTISYNSKYRYINHGISTSNLVI